MAGKNRMRIVFLCSGGGGNLRFVKQAVEQGWFGNADLAAVLTDRECAANEYARLHGIDEQRIDFTDASQTMLMALLDHYHPDIVITTVHRILNQDVVEKYRGKLINLHYSLLPAFGGSIGTKPVKDAIACGAKFTGVTVHFVDESVDGGRPIIQAAIPLRRGDTVDSVMDLVFRCGCISLGSAILLLSHRGQTDVEEIEDVVQLKDRRCLFSNTVTLPNRIQHEDYWDGLR